MKERRDQLWGMMAHEPYNSLLRDRYAVIKPNPAHTFYTISCGRRRTRPEDTTPSGVIFQDDSYLTIFEKWSVADNRILEYEFHYQRSDEAWVRYDLDSDAASASHPKHHLQTNYFDDIRLPTGEIQCEEVLQMIFEQFVGP
jgi:hypothetical protein